MNARKIVTARDLRGALLASIEAVLEGRLNVAQANAVVGMSAEVHKSLRQEWDMAIYATENISLNKGELVRILIGDVDEGV